MRQKSITECRGPRCSKPGINASMSGIMEARNNNGRLMSTLRDLDAAFPVKYPRAKCPTAYINYSFTQLTAHHFSWQIQNHQRYLMLRFMLTPGNRKSKVLQALYHSEFEKKGILKVSSMNFWTTLL